jgi:hypothetical protein
MRMEGRLLLLGDKCKKISKNLKMLDSFIFQVFGKYNIPKMDSQVLEKTLYRWWQSAQKGEQINFGNFNYGSTDKLEKNYCKSIKRFLTNIPDFLRNDVTIAFKKVTPTRFIFEELDKSEIKLFPFKKYRFNMPSEVKSEINVLLDMQQTSEVQEAIFKSDKVEKIKESCKRLNEEMSRVLGSTLLKNIVKRIQIEPTYNSNKKIVKTVIDKITDNGIVDLSNLGLKLQCLPYENVYINKVITCLMFKGEKIIFKEGELNKLPRNVLDDVIAKANLDPKDFKDSNIDKVDERKSEIDLDYILLRKKDRTSKDLQNETEWTSNIFFEQKNKK